ncbi:hypothetical protein HPB51_021058 [Rhipicephalus microplus]|uniref:RXYLT1 C-terminal domain-containing protein n=1 Tax=Rhipicephalus microplus TaxID=6941 RepID=A0A9J6ECP9_RHIMP|nr:hypothetical protein HPB51_021058 [Rhipicephalus microplus]
METDGSEGNATARKPSSKAKSHSTQNIPIQEAAQSPGGSALPPHTPSPPRPPPTGNTTAGLGADRADEPEVVHQPEEQPVPLRRSTRERRPPERLGDYVQWRPLETKESLESYLLALKLSDVTLNPAGKNPECYRIYEALEFGSLPVLEDRTVSPGCASADDANGTFRLLKKHKAPLVFVKNWTLELMPVLEREITMKPQERVDRRQAIVSWYSSFKLCHERQICARADGQVFS